MLFWPGAATSPSAVSKFCGILGNGQDKTAVSTLMVYARICNAIAFFLRIIQNHARVVTLCVFLLLLG